MSTPNATIIHDRLYKLGSVCYYDDDVISQEDFDYLVDHYYGVLDKLSAPWLNRDDRYDLTGRLNYHWRDDV